MQAAKDLFMNKYNDVLTAVDGRKSITMQTTPIANWYFGDIQNIPFMPALLFTGYSTQEQDDQGGWRRQKFELTIECWANGNRVEDVARSMRRYASAIDDCLRQNQDLGGIAQEITNIRQTFYDTVAKGAGLMQLCTVTCDVIAMTN